tara:strand:- start:189 stop:356 length:168 start_codon:yes stop_codon:yes gene_type:complete
MLAAVALALQPSIPWSPVDTVQVTDAVLIRVRPFPLVVSATEKEKSIVPLYSASK